MTSFAQELFAAFCSVLVRMYLNITIDHFSEVMSDLSLADEKKVVKKIFSGVSLLLHKYFGFYYAYCLRLNPGARGEHLAIQFSWMAP